MEKQEKDIRSEGQLARIARMGFWFIGIILGLYVLSAALVATGELNHSAEQMFRTFESQTLSLAGVIWTFLKPFFWLILCFLVLDWILRKLNIQLPRLTDLRLRMSFPSVLLLLVSFAFIAAVFWGKETEGIKEILLVLLGYYIGSQTDWLTLRKRKNEAPDKTDTPPAISDTEGNG